MTEHTCQDCGADADPDMTMDFTDVESGAYIYWCTACGVVANELNEVLQKALRERGPEFREQLANEIAIAEKGGRQ